MFEETATTQTETSEEKKSRRGRRPLGERPMTNAERVRKYREKNGGSKITGPLEIRDFSEIAGAWTRNEAALLKADPTLHSHLFALHNAIVDWEAEAEEIAEGVKNGLRAETRTAKTADSTEIFPMPDLSFKDLKAVAQKQGTANYREIEANAVNGRQGDDAEQHYVRYGFRLRLSHETLQNARENLALYALRTRDQTLNWEIVLEAIADCSAHHPRFSPNAAELRKLIQEHRSPKAPVAEPPTRL